MGQNARSFEDLKRCLCKELDLKSIMEYSTKPTTEAVKDKDGKDLPIVFKLEDKDFLLIDALNKLAAQVSRLANKP